MRRGTIKFYLILGSLMVVWSWPALKAQAATFSMLPVNGQVAVGQTFDLEVRINSDDQGFNAAQGVIQFPADILQVKTLDFSPTASVFSFWLEGPSFSNTLGRVNFLGGTTNGVVGASIQILKITFTAKATGEARIATSDAAITASDGSGSNILSTVANANVLVVPTMVSPLSSTTSIAKELPPAVKSDAANSSTTIAIPKPVVRQPTVAAEAPKAPELSVPLYPDQTKWYNEISNFLVKWKLPGDISGSSALINKEAKFDPPGKSEGLYDAKAFAPLSDGLWYVHAKLKNNIDWGPVAHYKIAIDTVPPLPFVINVKEGLVSDNPTPTLELKASDGLSGIAGYAIRVDRGEEFTVTSGSSSLPLQTPGKKQVVVKAIDNAGNSREAKIELEILPIAGPTIIGIGQEAFSNEGDLPVAGTALPNTTIWLALKNSDNAVVVKTKTNTDAQGNWGTQFTGPFKKGRYYIEAITQDARGAVSLAVESSRFSIKEKPLLVIAGLAITQLWFFLGLITVLLLAFVAGWWSYHLWRRQLVRRAVIAQRDIINVFANMEQELNKAGKICSAGNLDESKTTEVKTVLRSLKNRLTVAQKYIVENIKEIGD